LSAIFITSKFTLERVFPELIHVDFN